MTYQPDDSSRTSASPIDRMRLSLVLTVLFAVALFLANDAAWIARTVLNEDAFVGTLEPLPSDPDVAAALADHVSTALIETYSVDEAILSALPESLAFMTLPLTNGIENVAAHVAADIIGSDEFTTMWRGALVGSHRIAKTYVGATDSGLIAEEDGVAILDLTPLGSRITEAMSKLGFTILDGVDPDLEVELFAVPTSGFLRDVVVLMRSIRWVLFPLTLLLGAGAIIAATNRRRATAWLGAAIVASMIVALVSLRYVVSSITSGIEDPVMYDGAAAAIDIVFGGLIGQTLLLLLIGSVVLVGAWIGGPSESAVTVRGLLTGGARSASLTSSWAFTAMIDHRRGIGWGVLGITLAYLLFGPPLPVLVVTVWLVLLALASRGVEYLAGQRDVDTRSLDS